MHQKHTRRTSILKLEIEQGILEGHGACSEYLQHKVAELLLHPAVLDKEAQTVLLAEVDHTFTDEDNKMLSAIPTKEEVKESVMSSNVHGAPGSDGITSLLYRECFNILGDSLTVVQTVLKGEQPSRSQRTSLMMCAAKPGKVQS